MDHKLEIYVTTAEQKSFTRAAELLHMTPSAISLSIKALENKLGVRLFERSNKYVQLTEAGQVMYAQSKEILLKYDQLKLALTELEPSTAMPLSIGAAYTFGEYFLPGIIYAFSKRHPNITPNITIHNSKTIIEQIHKQELDIGFIVEGKRAAAMSTRNCSPKRRWSSSHAPTIRSSAIPRSTAVCLKRKPGSFANPAPARAM